MNLDVRWRRAALVAFALAVFLPGQSSLPPSDRDESRFAQATKQMTETGDYLRILNGAEQRNKKPIGIHWLQAPFALAGSPALANPIWLYRIPSVLGGVVAVVATFEAGLLLLVNPEAAFLAASMLAGSVILAVETHIAKTDAALLGATTLAMALLARAYLGLVLARWQAALFWLAMGAGILIKGPISPMVAGLAALTLVIADRRASWLRALRPGWGMPLMAGVVAPWFIAIGLATHGQFFAQAVGGDLGHKLAGGAESHGGFPGLHLLLVPLLAFPSSLLVLRALPLGWRARGQAPMRFLLAWLAPSWLVFEAVPTKLPHYTLPLYPALFLLAAAFTSRDVIPVTPRWLGAGSKAGLVLAAALIALGAIALPIYLHGSWWLGLPATAVLACVTALARYNCPGLALALMPLAYAALFAVELPNITALWIAPRVETVLKSGWPAWNRLGEGLAAAGYAEPSLMFVCGTETAFAASGRDAAVLMQHGDTAAIIATRDVPAFLAALSSLHVGVTEIGTVTGFNYSRGRWVTLYIYSKQPQPD